MCGNSFYKKQLSKILTGIQENFNFRGVDYPLFDLWGIACERLINTKAYKKKCLEMSMITSSGQFFKTSAETTFSPHYGKLWIY